VTTETMDVGDILDFVRERDRALSALDMLWARRMMPQASGDDVRLLAMHKARIHSLGVSGALRRESMRWLAAGKHTDLMGNPVDGEGPLPA